MKATTYLLAIFYGLLIPTLYATGNPYSGYTNTQSYMLDYHDSSFAVGNTSDVKVRMTIAEKEHIFNIDTGSRGLYVSIDELGPNFNTKVEGTYAGLIDLNSSGRIFSGLWVPTTASLPVAGGKFATTRFNILAVDTLGAQINRHATFGIRDDVSPEISKVMLVGGGTVNIEASPTGKGRIITLSNEGGINQQVSYHDNPNMLANVSNFGIGFDLTGAPGGTGPIANNQNQIYNALLNLDEMRSGEMVSGYIIKTTGIQLGLTTEDKGYGFTSLNSTGLQSDNSAPDWQTPMGQTVVNGITNLPGSIVMDSGIPNSFISDPSLKGGTITNLSVYLMNSGGAVGYHINLEDESNELNPQPETKGDVAIMVVPAGINGTYSQSQPPFQGHFFNTGRNVFEAFDMLYDASNGYMGLKPNEFGLSNPNVFFMAQEGGFPNPIPEPNTTILIGLAIASLLLIHRRIRTQKP